MGIEQGIWKGRRPPFRFSFTGIRSPEGGVTVDGHYGDNNLSILRDGDLGYLPTIYAFDRGRKGQYNILSRPENANGLEYISEMKKRNGTHTRRTKGTGGWLGAN